MFRNLYLLSLLIVLTLLACQSNQNSEHVLDHSLNLLEYGIPLAIMTPDSFTVDNNSTSLMQELKITSTDYLVYVYGYDMTGEPSVQKSKKMLEVQTDPYSVFGDILKEEMNGFVYSLKATGDTTTAYNFHRYIRVSNKLYHLTSSAGGRRPPFAKKQMIEMFNSTAND